MEKNSEGWRFKRVLSFCRSLGLQVFGDFKGSVLGRCVYPRIGMSSPPRWSGYLIPPSVLHPRGRFR